MGAQHGVDHRGDLPDRHGPGAVLQGLAADRPDRRRPQLRPAACRVDRERRHQPVAGCGLLRGDGLLRLLGGALRRGHDARARVASAPRRGGLPHRQRGGDPAQWPRGAGFALWLHLGPGGPGRLRAAAHGAAGGRDAAGLCVWYLPPAPGRRDRAAGLRLAALGLADQPRVAGQDRQRNAELPVRLRDHPQLVLRAAGPSARAADRHGPADPRGPELRGHRCPAPRRGDHPPRALRAGRRAGHQL